MFNELLQTNYKRYELQICFVRKVIKCIKHPRQTANKSSNSIRESHKNKRQRQYFDFIGGTLSYATYVMS